MIPNLYKNLIETKKNDCLFSGNTIRKYFGFYANINVSYEELRYQIEKYLKIRQIS